MTNRYTSSNGTTAVANPTQAQNLFLFRAGDGALFIDNVGSKIVREAPDNSEIVFDDCYCMEVKWVRPWKMEGKSSPDDNVGNTFSTADELSKLHELHLDGILSDEEYKIAKMKTLGEM